MCSCWSMQISFNIVPSINCLHPILSCDSASFRKRCPHPLVISSIVFPPRPRAYSIRPLRRALSMSASRSHLSTRSMDSISVSTLPSSSHIMTCSQDSRHMDQLRQSGSCSSLYFDWLRFVPAILITCLHAQILNILGTSCRVSYTAHQSTSSNCSG